MLVVLSGVIGLVAGVVLSNKIKEQISKVKAKIVSWWNKDQQP